MTITMYVAIVSCAVNSNTSQLNAETHEDVKQRSKLQRSKLQTACQFRSIQYAASITWLPLVVS